jgi:hypothetical protein
MARRYSAAQKLKIALEAKAKRYFARLKNGSESATHEFS